MRAPPTIAHVAMPFARSGSAITNVIRHLCHQHQVAGGTSYAVLSHNRETVVDHAKNLYVDHTEFCPRQWFTASEMRRDQATGALGMNRPFTSRIAIPAIRAVAEVQPDVIVIHEGHYASSALSRWRAALPDARLVLYVHTPLSRSYLRPELTRLLKVCDDIVFVSDFTRRQLSARLKLRSRTHVVLNGTQPDPTLLRERTDPPLLLFVGQVAQHKGPHLLVSATAELIRRGHRVNTLIVGSSVHGPTSTLTDYEIELRNNAAGLGDAIRFRPFVQNSELAPIYRSATVVAMPSLWDEPCGLVLLEALGTGAPVVATRRGGIPEVGLDAISYAGESAASFADAIEPLISADDEVNRAMSREALARAKQITWSQQYQLLMRSLAT